MAIMQCVVPICHQCDSSRIASQETKYFKFPLDPSLRAAWLETLQKTDWQPDEDSAVCSKHFLPGDIVEDSSGLQTLRENAIPVITVQACRICFATDCKLYPLTTYTILNMAYKTLTGLSIQRDQIPHYLCNVCAHQLLECARFRTKSLEAHSVLLEIATKNNCITLESIQSFHGIQNPIASNKACENSEQYDIDMEVAEMENINATEQTETTQVPVLFEDITVDCVKLETDDDNEETDSYKSLTNNVMVCIASEPDDKAEDTDVMSSDINDKLKDNDVSKDMEAGEQNNQGDVLDDPRLEDDSQNEQSNTKNDIPELEDGRTNNEQGNTKEQEDTMDDEVEVFVVIEEDDSTMEDSSEKPENENTPLIYDDTPSESLVLDEGDPNAKQGTQEEQDVKNVPEQLNKAADTARNPQVEGENSSTLPLEEIRQETEASTKAAEEVRIVLEKLKYSNVEIHGNLDGISNQVLSCDKCPFQTINKMQMTSHLKAHAASKSYNCSMCNYKTIHKRSLAWHAPVHSKEKPYSCDTCDKKFRHKCRLLVHMRQHSGKKPYSCSFCKKKFSEMTDLRRHVIIHTGEKPYLCDVCNKAFRQISHLKKHIRMHAGEKPYVCDYCEKACSQKVHLIKHMRIHIDNLRYACKICNKIFRHDVTLENHMRKHSSKKTYSCEVCKSVYSQRSRLRIHMKIHTV